MKYTTKELIIENLNKKHLPILLKFNSHEKELINFLLEDAYNHQKMNISKTFLFFDKKTKKLLSYITLLNDSINLEGAFLKQFFRDKEIHYKSMPAIKIGRLCVDEQYLRKGIGTIMIKFSIYISFEIMQKYSGCRFITLDAKRNKNKQLDSIHFYKKLGFKILKNKKKGTMPMYLDIKI